MTGARINWDDDLEALERELAGRPPVVVNPPLRVHTAAKPAPNLAVPVPEQDRVAPEAERGRAAAALPDPSAEEEPGWVQLQVVDLAGVSPAEVSWLWQPYIPAGKLTLIDGDPGSGKSWLTLAIATAVSTGAPFPRDTTRREPRNVVLVGAEDGLADTVAPRLRSMGADLARIRAVQVAREADGSERVVDLDRDLPLIEGLVAAWRPALLVVDPIQAHVGGRTDLHKANEIRAVLAPLALLAERHQVAVLVIRHLRKSSGDKALYRGLGTIDFAAVARSVLVVGPDPEDPARRGVAQIKSSLAPAGEPIAFRLDGKGFTWEGAAPELTAERLLAAANDEEPSALAEAADFLAAALAAGPMSAKQVLADARAAGISEKTLRRAKATLGVEAVPEQGERGRRAGWLWRLPGAGPDGQATHAGEAPLNTSFGHLVERPENRMKSTFSPDGQADEVGHLVEMLEPRGFSATSPDGQTTYIGGLRASGHLDAPTAAELEDVRRRRALAAAEAAFSEHRRDCTVCRPEGLRFCDVGRRLHQAEQAAWRAAHLAPEGR